MQSISQLLSTRLAVDIIFIALVIVAITITAIVLARAMTDVFGTHLESNSAEQAQKTGQDDDFSLVITDPDANANPGADFSREEYPITPPPTAQISDTMYESSAYILPITWGAVGGTLIWRGRVRSAWSKQGYDYDTFKLVAKMRGSPTRIRLLNAINSSSKNKLQLAKELDVDWKTMDNHIAMLLQSRLVEEKTVIGTSKYYAITHDGAKVLSLLSSDQTADRESNHN
jgi:predicted transcriptional regulator